MNYVYDILLNFNFDFYDFYDWNENDIFTHIKSIPIYRVNNNTLKDIIYNDVYIDKSFLKEIYNNTEMYLKYSLRKIKYSVLLCDDKNVLAIKCDSNGHVVARSTLLIDEFYEVISLQERYSFYDLKYSIIKSLNYDPLSYRNFKNTIKKEI